MDSRKSAQQPPRRRRGAPIGNQNARTHGFYSSRFTKKELDSLQDAVRLNDLQGEIALLRLKIRRIVANPDAPPELLFQAINALVRTMELNERINKIRR